MKKLFLLFSFLTMAFISNLEAQKGGNNAQRLQKFKERVKPLLMQKTGLSDADADKVIKIRFNYAGLLRQAGGATEAEKKKLTEEIMAAENKEYSAIPLTPAQVKTIREFFDEQRKERQK